MLGVIRGDIEMNDIDLWNYIDELEHDGNTKESTKLLLIYKELYIEHTKKRAEQLIDKFDYAHLNL